MMYDVRMMYDGVYMVFESRGKTVDDGGDREKRNGRIIVSV